MPTHELTMAELPREAHLRYDSVPSFPTCSDFERAEKLAATESHPAAIWYREATRWRMANEGRPLDLIAIADAVLRALH